MKYLLDTHTLIWYFDASPKLPRSAVDLIKDPLATKYVGFASLWEIALKMSPGKLQPSFTFEELIFDLKNSDIIILQYDMIWVIGDINVARNPKFRMSVRNHNGSFLYEGIDGVSEYMQSKTADEFEKAVYYILDEHLKNGTESITHLELAMQYCIHSGRRAWNL